MSARTVFSALEETAARYAGRPALYQPCEESGAGTVEAGELRYRVYSWTEYRQAAVEIAAGLRGLGIGKGDMVALCSETRAEFYLADLGVMANGSISAALYSSYPAAELVRTLHACDARAVFVENPAMMRSLRAVDDPQPGVPWILLTGEEGEVLTLTGLRDNGRQAIQTDPELIGRICSEVGPSDPAILYLTSGATGEPKMALVSHAALLANMDMAPSVISLGPEDSTVAFMPSAHIAQRVVLELIPLRCGTPVWFVDGLVQLPQALRAAAPTAFLAPPRFWERVHATARTEIQKRPAIARNAVYAALGLSLEARTREREGRAVPAWMRAGRAFADRVVFRKLRARFGGRLRIAISGAAPLGKHLAEFFDAAGVPLVEGYGLTEGGIVSLNPPGKPKPGSIGKTLPGVEVKLAEDGELLIRGPCLLSAYYKDPEATAEVLREGWLHSGDIAEIDSEGYISITGRKKEVIITSSGKKVFPAQIENLFKPEPLVSHVVLLGDGRPYLTALFTLIPAAGESANGRRSAAEEVRQAVARVNRRLAPFEQIRKHRILDRDFTIKDGELTATMKVRRSRVIGNHKAVIDGLYAGVPD